MHYSTRNSIVSRPTTLAYLHESSIGDTAETGSRRETERTNRRARREAREQERNNGKFLVADCTSSVLSTPCNSIERLIECSVINGIRIVAIYLIGIGR